MRMVIRKYAGNGAKEIFDLLEARQADMPSVMGAVNGLVSYTLARTADGGITITVCQDQAGVEESTRVAKDWLAKNATGIDAGPPEVTYADVILQLN